MERPVNPAPEQDEKPVWYVRLLKVIASLSSCPVAAIASLLSDFVTYIPLIPERKERAMIENLSAFLRISNEIAAELKKAGATDEEVLNFLRKNPRPGLPSSTGSTGRVGSIRPFSASSAARLCLRIKHRISPDCGSRYTSARRRDEPPFLACPRPAE